jgi:hypothetical protein
MNRIVDGQHIGNYSNNNRTVRGVWIAVTYGEAPLSSIRFTWAEKFRPICIVFVKRCFSELSDELSFSYFAVHKDKRHFCNDFKSRCFTEVADLHGNYYFVESSLIKKLLLKSQIADRYPSSLLRYESGPADHIGGVGGIDRKSHIETLAAHSLPSDEPESNGGDHQEKVENGDTNSRERYWITDRPLPNSFAAFELLIGATIGGGAGLFLILALVAKTESDNNNREREEDDRTKY